MKPSEYNLNILAEHPLFALLPSSKVGEQARQQLLAQVQIQEYTKDEIIFLQHSPVVTLCFLLSGRVNCYRQLPSGQESLIVSYGQLGLINESVLWDWHHLISTENIITLTHSKPNIATKHSALLTKQGGIHQFTAISKEPSMVASLCAQAYFEVIQKFDLGRLIMWFCDYISKRLYQYLISSDLLAFVQAKPKLAYYLLTHHAIGIPFELGLSQKQLAAQIGLRPETLSRTFKELIALKLISKDKNRYTLIDAEGLLALVSE